jgi:hypothetical protein
MPKITNPGIFKCPKCFRGGEPTVLASLGTWKNHMTKMHGGFSDEEVTAAAGPAGNEGIALGGGESFDQASAAMPESAESFRLTPPEAGAFSAPKERAPKPAKVNAAIAANLQDVKRRLAETLPMIFGHWINKALDRPKLSDGEMKEKCKPVTEAIQTVLNALGVDIQIDPINTVIKSRLWLILIPLGALLATFFGELMQYVAAFGKAKTEEISDTPAVPESTEGADNAPE